MKKTEVKLLTAKKVARDTLCLKFDLAGQPLEFQPGQFVTLSLPLEPSLAEDDRSRTFSIASAPEERHLMLATRLTGSGFKKALAAMQPGDTAQIQGPAGKFIFDAPESEPIIFLAGGIGITPFRSMIKSVLERNSSRPLLLVYSNRTPEDAAFLDELERWSGALPNFRLLATMTHPEKSSTAWKGATGRVDDEFLKQNVPELSNSEIYAAGPPGFVQGMTKSLQDAGVPQKRIHAEEFSGY